MFLDRREAIPAYKGCRATCSLTGGRPYLQTKDAGPLVPRQTGGHTCTQRMQGLLFLDRQEAIPAHKGGKASCFSTDKSPYLHTKDAGPLVPRQARGHTCTQRMQGPLSVHRGCPLASYKQRAMASPGLRPGQCPAEAEQCSWSSQGQTSSLNFGLNCPRIPPNN